jgi:Na+/phosphate symporter
LYLWLPAGDESLPDPLLSATDDFEAQRLDITAVTPHEAAAGSAIVVNYAGATGVEPARVWIGKSELSVLSRRPGAVVAELPAQLPDDRIKLRVSIGAERSKTYELHIKPRDFRKPFRNLCGGFVLLMLGVAQLARAAHRLSGSSTRRWTKTGPWQLLTLGAGAGLGGLMHSSTATAGILAGAVGSRVISLQPAAALFLGSQLGAAATPFLFADGSEPHAGLIAVAIGGVSLRLASDRQGRALAWLVLSGGIVAFALQVLRPGFEPIVSNSTLLGLLDHVSPHGLAGELALVLLGVFLVVLFQGPAPVLVLSLAIGQMLGHTEPRTTLLLLSGSGLGAALGALLTTPFGLEGRRLAELNLLAGACSTLLTAASVDIFDQFGQRFVGFAQPVHFGHHLLPDGAFHVALAFAASQLMAALIVLALLPLLDRLLQRRSAVERRAARAHAGMLAELRVALEAQSSALPALQRLSVDADRTAGREAERRLRESEVALERALEQDQQDVAADGGEHRGIALSALQLQRALTHVLSHAQRLTDARIGWCEPDAGITALSQPERQVLQQLFGLVEDGLASLHSSLRSGLPPDTELSSAREIQMNALESQLRAGLAQRAGRRMELARGLYVIALVDALEGAGNQLYRLTDAFNLLESQQPAQPVGVAPLSAAPRGGSC